MIALWSYLLPFYCHKFNLTGSCRLCNDYLSSAATVVQGVPEARGVKRALSEGDMHLQGWLSNSIEFLKAMAVENGPSDDAELSLDSDTTEKVLGVY